MLSVDDLKVGNEDSRHHILHHLQALTIPIRAAAKIVNLCFNAPPAISLKAYQVIVTPDTDVIPEKYFNRFGAEFAKWCDADFKIVNQVLADLWLWTLNITPSVHVEAVLMSLATAAEVKVDGMPAPGASLLHQEYVIPTFPTWPSSLSTISSISSLTWIQLHILAKAMSLSWPKCSGLAKSHK